VNFHDAILAGADFSNTEILFAQEK